MNKFIKILNWILGVVFALIAIGLLSDNYYFSFILMLFASLILIPPLHEKIKKKGIKGLWLFLIAFSAFFISIVIAFNPNETETEITNEIESKTEKAFIEKGKVGYDKNGNIIEAKTEYEIIKAENYQNIKFTYDIRLSNDKLLANELSDLAIELKDKLDRDYERIFITYYLPEDKVGSGAWAISHFNPDLKVSILGLTPADIENLVENYNQEKPEEKVIGKWIAGSYKNAYFIILFEKNGKLYKAMRNADESVEDEMLLQDKSGVKRYVKKGENEFGEYYIINENGELEIYDQDGFIEKLKIVE